MELVRLAEKTYYITGAFQVGVFVIGQMGEEKKVCLIDSGLDERHAALIDTQLQDNNMVVDMIINTHYHADHCGGNAYFHKKYDCKCYATRPNAALIANYDICPAIIWGGKTVNEIINSYFYATPCETEDIETLSLPEGLEIIDISGHSLSMIGVKTSDEVVFLGDGIVSRHTLEEHRLTYVYDIGKHLKSLDAMLDIKAKLYVPYHATPMDDIKDLVLLNKKTIEDNIRVVKEICSVPRTMDEIINSFFTRYGYTLTMYKYAVEGGVIRSYVTYLYNRGELGCDLESNFLKWRSVIQEDTLEEK